MKNNITFDEALTIENLYLSWKFVKKSCKNKRNIFNFEKYLHINIINLYNILKNDNYKPYSYKLFLIYEPKPRLVMSQCIIDKIVNHFITKFILIPNLDKKLIDQNIATRVNKGSSYGNKLMINYINALRLKGNVFCLKLDISKYFYNIDHNILINKLINDNIDDKTIKIISSMLDETNKPYINKYINKVNMKYHLDIPIYKYDIGLSIGAVVNQFLAIYYLNDVIKFIKEKLKFKYVILYMDDLLILHNDKEVLKSIKPIIEEHINSLGLKLNPKSTICSLKNGINFLGIRNYEYNGKYIRGFRKSTIKKIDKRLNYLKKSDKIKYNRSLASYHGYYLNIDKNNKGDFKLKNIDKYNSIKENNKNSIIFVKDGNFYKTYKDDAIIIWYLFNYIYVNDSVSFGNKAYNKVFDQLNRFKISYIIVEDNELYNIFNNDNYSIYLKLSKDNFNNKNRLNNLYNRIVELINKDDNNYNLIDDFISKLEK